MGDSQTIETRTTGRTMLPSADISPQSYCFFQHFISRESGIVLDDDKRYLLEARLMPIALKLRLYSLNDLCILLQTTTDLSLRQQVVEAMTTNETFFFRETSQYEALKSTVLPELVQERQLLRKISVWSAAASTGQEAYSLAMLLLEMGLGNWDISIVGTDLSAAVLQRARAGRYLQIEVNRGLPAPLLVKYFKREGLEWQLLDEVRRMVRFEREDLRRDTSAMGPFDLVFCRNVLIYFDVPTKRSILSRIRRCLAPGGHLLLGGSETTLNLDDRFVRRPVGNAMLYQMPRKETCAQ
ncbi:MAG: CheR family methyltransferase [Bryobacteraceae bacterium]